EGSVCHPQSDEPRDDSREPWKVRRIGERGGGDSQNRAGEYEGHRTSESSEVGKVTSRSGSVPPTTRAAFAAAILIGAFVRLYFLTSHGSWDMDYWKAWANEAATKGIAQVYGGPETVPEGEFLGQLSGRLPRSQVTFRGRVFPI